MIINNFTQLDIDKYLISVSKELDIYDSDVTVVLLYSKVKVTGYDLKSFVNEELVGGKYVYKIYINKGIGINTAVKIICHEFVHIKQYMDGRLKIEGTIATFEGNVYDMLEVQYEDRPWEVEAFGMQGKLYKRVKKRMKDDGT